MFHRSQDRRQGALGLLHEELHLRPLDRSPLVRLQRGASGSECAALHRAHGFGGSTPLAQRRRPGNVMVTIRDDCTAYVSGAIVSGHFSGDFDKRADGVTGRFGAGLIRSAPASLASRCGERPVDASPAYLAWAKTEPSYTFCVDDVRRGGVRR